MTVNGGPPVHPLFLYEMLWNAAGFAVLHFYSKKRRFSGEIFLLYVAWYGLGRGFMEGLRDVKFILAIGDLPASQLVAFLTFAVALGVFVYMRFFKKTHVIHPLPAGAATGEHSPDEEAPAMEEAQPEMDIDARNEDDQQNERDSKKDADPTEPQ